MLYTSISYYVPEVLGMLVQDELSGRKSFSLFLVHVRQELTVNGFRLVQSASWGCIALLLAQEVLQGIGAVPQSHCTPGPAGHPKTCLLPLPCPLHQAWQKPLRPLGMEHDLPPQALVLTGQEPGPSPKQQSHDVLLEILWSGINIWYILVYTKYILLIYQYIIVYTILSDYKQKMVHTSIYYVYTFYILLYHSIY